jgi:hypothetical protein
MGRRNYRAKNQANQEEPKKENASSQDTNATPRVNKALRFRRLGYTYEEIAHECGYAHASNARKAIKAEEAKLIRDDAKALVNLQLDRIDFALRHAVMPAIEKGDTLAVNQLNMLLKRQSELLGLDAPPHMPPQNVTVIEEMPEGV